jgi:molecular chaperone DnaK (HSP70)
VTSLTLRLPFCDNKSGVTGTNSLSLAFDSVSTIAIDFGYTSSQVAVLEGTAPKVIENIEGAFAQGSSHFKVKEAHQVLLSYTLRETLLV